MAIAALLAAQTFGAAQSVAAAELLDEQGITAQQRGTFAGARLRAPLGGKAGAGKARASLAFAPTQRSRFASGGERLGFGEGMELSLAGGEAVTLRIGGASLGERLAAAEEGKDKGKRDSTGKKVLKGAIIVGIVGAAAIGGLFLLFAVACDGNRCSE